MTGAAWYRFSSAHRHPERGERAGGHECPHPDIWGHREVDPIQADATDGYVPPDPGALQLRHLDVSALSLFPHLNEEEVAQYQEQWGSRTPSRP